MYAYHGPLLMASKGSATSMGFLRLTVNGNLCSQELVVFERFLELLVFSGLRGSKNVTIQGSSP